MEHDPEAPEDPRPAPAGDTSIPPGVSLHEVTPIQAKAEQSGDDYKTRQLTLNRRLVNLTGGLVVVGSLGFGVAVWQSLIASRTADAARIAADAARITAEAAEQSASAARTSAEAAQAQAAASRDQAAAMDTANTLTEQGREDAAIAVQDETRARLSFGVSVRRDVSTANPSLALELHLQTGGSTEARQVRSAVTVSVGTPGGTRLPSDESWENAEWSDFGVVAAAEDNRLIIAEASMSSAQAADYLAGTAAIAAMIRIEYCDVFGRRFHTTRCAERTRDLLPREINYCGTDSGRVPDADAMCSDQ